MEQIWTTKKSKYSDEEVAEFCKKLNGYLDIKLTKMLMNRVGSDLNNVRAYLRPSLQNLHNPFLFNDMDKAVERLCCAIDSGERIMIYGDYDVDGTTSVALVYSFLNERYNNLEYYVPDRYTEGYGVSFKGVDVAYNHGCTLIIALDCGIKDNPRVDYAKEKGIDFIICDHHNPGDELPKAVAVLDAKRKDNTYPFNELSGCGVGFKFMQAFCIRRNIPFEKLFDYLDFTALSIGSDIVPIVDENRILAYYGLLKLNSLPFNYLGETFSLKPRICFEAIMREANLMGDNQSKIVTIEDAIFMIGPRINAAGRMKSGIEAVKLMVSNNMEEAKNFAESISSYNEKRKKTDDFITKSALKILEQDPDNLSNCSTVVYGKGWHKGVVGIVASRLTSSHFRPTIVLSLDDEGMLCGSARSVSDFNLYDAIDSCRKYLTAFGGHKFAAGLHLKLENYEVFRRDFEKYVREHITEEQKHPIIEIEQYISFADITPEFFSKLQEFQPFGPDNPEPIFATKGVKNCGHTRTVGKDHKHLRLEVIDDSRKTMIGIGFGLGDFAEIIKQNVPVDICYTIVENEFKGKKSLQLMVKDAKQSEALQLTMDN